MADILDGGQPKGDLPLTGKNCIDRIVTDMAVIDLSPNGFVLKELAPGLSEKEVLSATGGKITISPELKEMSL